MMQVLEDLARLYYLWIHDAIVDFFGASKDGDEIEMAKERQVLRDVGFACPYQTCEICKRSWTDPQYIEYLQALWIGH
jgi:hypothetical protein